MVKDLMLDLKRLRKRFPIKTKKRQTLDHFLRMLQTTGFALQETVGRGCLEHAADNVAAATVLCHNFVTCKFRDVESLLFLRGSDSDTKNLDSDFKTYCAT